MNDRIKEVQTAAELEAGKRWPYTPPPPWESLDFSQRDVDARSAKAFIEGALFEARRSPVHSETDREALEAVVWNAEIPFSPFNDITRQVLIDAILTEFEVKRRSPEPVDIAD